MKAEELIGSENIGELILAYKRRDGLQILHSSLTDTWRKLMKDCRQFYIDGKWVNPAGVDELPVINPATEERIATISLGTATDVDKAVAAAKRAFESYSETSRDSRLGLLQRIIEVYQSRVGDLAETISREMGSSHLAFPCSTGPGGTTAPVGDGESAGELQV